MVRFCRARHAGNYIRHGALAEEFVNVKATVLSSTQGMAGNSSLVTC